MGDTQTPVPPPPPGNLFAEPPRERSFPTTAVAIAAVAIVILVGVFVLLSRRHEVLPANPQALAAYAPNLQISNVEMSESTSISGGKSTYIDGHIANHGTATVTGITVRVLFANDAAMPPQTITVQMYVIRAREPYVDTVAVGASPLAPGKEADFRLTFEGINDNWNGQLPEIRIVNVETK